MERIMVILGVLFVGSLSSAGALPYEYYSCKAQGTTEDGTLWKGAGGGMSETEAAQNALYNCNLGQSVSVCKVVSCTWQSVRPRRP